MTLQASGEIKLSQIATEFGDTMPYSLSEFYKNGGKVPPISVNNSISDSGLISMSSFYGSSKCFHAGTNTTLYSNLSGQSSIGEGFWRVLESWTTPYCGDVKLTGHYEVSWPIDSKIILVGIYINNIESQRLYSIGDANYHAIYGYYNYDTGFLSPGDVVQLKGYVWGHYGSDRFNSSSMNVSTT